MRHPYGVDPGLCQHCNHPVSHHDAGECWTDTQGREVYDEVDGQCPCSWLTLPGDAS